MTTKYKQSPKANNTFEKTVGDISGYEKMLDSNVLSGRQKKSYMNHMSPRQRRRIEVQENLEDLLQYKQRRINKQFKPIEYYFNNTKDKIDFNDVDLAEKANEYYRDHYLGQGKHSKFMKYDDDPEIIKLMHFVEWAKSRGGLEAFNQLSGKGEDQMTKEDREMTMPFWRRTYMCNGKEYYLDPIFVNASACNIEFAVRDNPSAYQAYKKRELFPQGRPESNYDRMSMNALKPVNPEDEEQWQKDLLKKNE